jgi:hypothetical protein
LPEKDTMTGGSSAGASKVIELTSNRNAVAVMPPRSMRVRLQAEVWIDISNSFLLLTDTGYNPVYNSLPLLNDTGHNPASQRSAGMVHDADRSVNLQK